jgi:hypothetical protein
MCCVILGRRRGAQILELDLGGTAADGLALVRHCFGTQLGYV